MASADESYKQRAECRDRVRMAIEVLTFIALVIYATITYCLVRNAWDSSEIANRPIVAVSAYEPRAFDSANPKRMFAYVQIRNFGRLPTKVGVRKATTFRRIWTRCYA